MSRWLATEGQGRIAMEADGKVDLDAGRIGYLRWLRDPARRSARSEAETRYRDLKARHLQIKIAEDERRLIEVADCFEVIDGFAGLVLTELSALPARLAGHNLGGRRTVEQETFDLRQRLTSALAEKTATWRDIDSAQ